MKKEDFIFSERVKLDKERKLEIMAWARFFADEGKKGNKSQLVREALDYYIENVCIPKYGFTPYHLLNSNEVDRLDDKEN